MNEQEARQKREKRKKAAFERREYVRDEFRRNPAWQELRDAKLEDNGPLCPLCGEPNGLVLVTRDLGASWQEMSNFDVMCRRCKWLQQRMEEGDPVDDLIVGLDFDQFIEGLVAEQAKEMNG